MANFSFSDPTAVTDDTDVTKKKKPLIRPLDVRRPDADQPYDFGVPNAQQPIGGNPQTYDVNGSAKAGFLANSAVDPEFVKKAAAGLPSAASAADPNNVAAPTLQAGPTQPAATAGAAPDQSLLAGIAAGIPQQPNITAMASPQAQIQSLNEQQARDLGNYHPSKMRQFLSGLAGVGTGIMERNPVAGFNAYKGILDAPKGEIRERTAEQEAPLLQQIASQKDLAGIENTYMQRMAEIGKLSPNSPEGIAANARALAAQTGAAKQAYDVAHPETRNINVGGTTPGATQEGVVGTRTGTTPFTPVGPEKTPKPTPQGFEPKQLSFNDAARIKAIIPSYNEETGVAGTYDKSTGKYFVKDMNGQDVDVSTFGPIERQAASTSQAPEVQRGVEGIPIAVKVGLRSYPVTNGKTAPDAPPAAADAAAASWSAYNQGRADKRADADLLEQRRQEREQRMNDAKMENVPPQVKQQVGSAYNTKDLIAVIRKQVAAKPNLVGPAIGRAEQSAQGLGSTFGFQNPADEQDAALLSTNLANLLINEAKTASPGRSNKELLDIVRSVSAQIKDNPNMLEGHLKGVEQGADIAIQGGKRFGLDLENNKNNKSTGGATKTGAGWVIDPAGKDHYVKDIQAAIKLHPGTKAK